VQLRLEAVERGVGVSSKPADSVPNLNLNDGPNPSVDAVAPALKITDMCEGRYEQQCIPLCIVR
jgi:hypothetical protein